VQVEDQVCQVEEAAQVQRYHVHHQYRFSQIKEVEEVLQLIVDVVVVEVEVDLRLEEAHLKALDGQIILTTTTTTTEVEVEVVYPGGVSHHLDQDQMLDKDKQT